MDEENFWGSEVGVREQKEFMSQLPKGWHMLLVGMLHAVYVDLVGSRSIIGILPKVLFYPLFESLQHKPESRVMVFNPDGNSDVEKITAPEEESQGGEILGWWRRGESRTPRLAGKLSLMRRHLTKHRFVQPIGIPKYNAAHTHLALQNSGKTISN